jgi:hypothetical protein
VGVERSKLNSTLNDHTKLAFLEAVNFTAAQLAPLTNEEVNNCIGSQPNVADVRAFCSKARFGSGRVNATYLQWWLSGPAEQPHFNFGFGKHAATSGESGDLTPDVLDYMYEMQLSPRQLQNA